MDTRYRDYGYTAKIEELDCGVFLDVFLGTRRVAHVAVGFFEGGKSAPLQLIVKTNDHVLTIQETLA